MHVLDYVIFLLYMIGILGIGYYHYRRNKSNEDYYVGGRAIPPTALGLSVVATDVGGGFSIGLGGVGFLMGLSGSWLLFSGLVGAWLTAVFVIPKIKRIDASNGMLSFPDFLRFRYDNRVALLAAIISAIGYLMFTGSQIRAGAALASETIFRTPPFSWDPFLFSLYAMAFIIIVYTVMGGIKAVIYTDFAQWLILLVGLIAFAIPFSLHAIGGIGALRAQLPESFFSLQAIEATTFINWMVTIVPIWLVGMTLYQRMYACKGPREGRKAWLIAGIFEYPIMAFMGVFLGMCARAMYPELLDVAGGQELGLPRLINDVLPIGVTGIVAAAYFSAIMSTADSCLMASSGNIVGDFLQRYVLAKHTSDKTLMRCAQVVTLLLGILAVIYAQRFGTVIDGVFNAYGFLVAGLFVPTLGAFFWRGGTSTGALWAILAGGGLTQILPWTRRWMPADIARFFFETGLDPVVYGMAASAIVFVGVSLLTRPTVPCKTESDAG